ncbi:MAG TPA: molybdopterin adenylyltransferase [Clostridia bacterium]|nr:molybdopterin adenylyltransferase [Clostridia bacterium]
MIRVGVITASDKGSRGEREDLSAPVITELVSRIGGMVEFYAVVPDDRSLLEQKLVEFVDERGLDLVFTTGGTGFAPRDITPEATLAIADKLVPGLGEAMRAASLQVTPKAMLSRAMAVIRKQSLIINLPGSPKAVRECLEVILPSLPHGIDILKQRAGECAEEQP